jgi:MinD-like ATPase involved in chromosome partitioning or flagellar assembly
VDIARSLDVPNLMLMVNKGLPKHDLADIRKQIEDKFGAPVAGVLPLSFEVAENASQDIFSLRYPDHPWSKALRGVAETVLAIK